MATRAKGDLIGVHIRTDDGLTSGPTTLLDEHRALLEGLGGTYHEIVGSEIPTALTRFARAEHATQIILGATGRSRWRELTHGSVINSVIRASGDMDIHVISEDSEDEHRTPLVRPHVLRSPLPIRRLIAGWTIGLVGLPVLTLVLVGLRDHVDLPGDLMIYLLLIVATATVGGIGPAVFTAIVSALAVNWFFTPPIHTFTISDTGNGLASSPSWWSVW
jgi:two-component system, OmpR family, sensor histidine kinase KdpD